MRTDWPAYVAAEKNRIVADEEAFERLVDLFQQAHGRTPASADRQACHRSPKACTDTEAGQRSTVNGPRGRSSDRRSQDASSIDSELNKTAVPLSYKYDRWNC